MSLSTCLKSLSNRKSTNSLLSAVDGRVVITSVFVEVEVSYGCTIGNILIDVIHCIGLNTGGERSHLSHITLVPDGTLHKTLASTNRIEVDGGGRSQELHGVFRLCAYYRAERSQRMSPCTTTSAGTREMV